MAKTERHIGIRKSDKWEKRSYENYETVKEKNKGHNRIRKNDNWYQVPRMDGGNIYGE